MVILCNIKYILYNTYLYILICLYINVPEWVRETKKMKTKIKNHKKPLRAVGYFAHLNKNCTIGQYEKEVLKGDYNRENILVMKTIEVDFVTYRGLQETLLHDVDLWDKIGGHDIDPAAEKLNPELFKEIKETTAFWKLSKEAIEFYRANALTLCVEVILKSKKNYGNDWKFYVNTEGFGYARYVGLSQERFDWLMFQEAKDQLGIEKNTTDMAWEEYHPKLDALEKKYNQKEVK